MLGRKPEITEVESSKLRLALGKLALEISGVLQDVKQVGKFKLNEVQVGVEITAEGGVATGAPLTCYSSIVLFFCETGLTLTFRG